MLTLTDIYTIEQDNEETEQEYYEAVQRAINSGTWGLQGSYGRTMMEAVKGGYCLLGHIQARDYYGNTIPSRDDVEEGTKGSYEYVVRMQGQEWADSMGDLK